MSTTTRDWGRFALHHGDNLTVLRSMPDACFDSIVTDPPYGLGKEPDALAMLRDWLTTGHHDVTGAGFMGRQWDAFVPQPAAWRECLRVLKPGGHLLTFGGTRTFDLVVLGLRIAGFEVRDTLAWVYGSGFPKSLDVSKALEAYAKTGRSDSQVTGDGRSRVPGQHFKEFRRGNAPKADFNPTTDAARQWQGWGTALKPAYEPIVMARKPLIGNVAENVLAHGTGAINIDGCRVGDEARYNPPAVTKWTDRGYEGRAERGKDVVGRWPANLLHDGSDEVVALFPTDRPGMSSGGNGRRDASMFGVGGVSKPEHYRNDTGSAARFFWCPKASASDRHDGTGHKGNRHPTVKPTDLMRYLCVLVTPPGGKILDPWAGSGSTGKGAVPAGFQFVGIDRDDWLDVQERRIVHAWLGAGVFRSAA